MSSSSRPVSRGRDDAPPPPPTTEELLQRQTDAMRRQDEELDALSGTIAETRDAADAIGDVAHLHTRLLEDITDDVERGSQALGTETRRLDVVRRRADVRSLWFIIAALSAALFVMILMKL